jgi:hypothetical protein
MEYGTATVIVALAYLHNAFASPKRAQIKVLYPMPLRVAVNGTTDTRKGRWFYTCQNGEGRKCGMFLWDDDARPREAAALLNNSRTEPTSTPAKPLSLVHSSPQKMQSSPNSTSTLSHPSNTLKRPFTDAGLDDNVDVDHDSFPWSLSDQEEAKLLDAPQTPRKVVKIDGIATPVTSVHRKLPWLDHSAQSPLQAFASATSLYAVNLESGCRTTRRLNTTGHSKSLTLSRLVSRYTISPIHTYCRCFRRSGRLESHIAS